MKINAIVTHNDDNVAVVTEPIRSGDPVRTSGRELFAGEDIPACHKVAIAPIPKGARILRYGHGIGIALCDIEAGRWVHTHNIASEED